MISFNECSEFASVTVHGTVVEGVSIAADDNLRSPVALCGCELIAVAVEDNYPVLATGEVNYVTGTYVRCIGVFGSGTEAFAEYILYKISAVCAAAR